MCQSISIPFILLGVYNFVCREDRFCSTAYTLMSKMWAKSRSPYEEEVRSDDYMVIWLGLQNFSWDTGNLSEIFEWELVKSKSVSNTVSYRSSHCGKNFLRFDTWKCHRLTLRFFFKFVSRAYSSKIHWPNESPRKQKM